MILRPVLNYVSKYLQRLADVLAYPRSTQLKLSTGKNLEKQSEKVAVRIDVVELSSGEFMWEITLDLQAGTVLPETVALFVNTPPTHEENTLVLVTDERERLYQDNLLNEAAANLRRDNR